MNLSKGSYRYSVGQKVIYNGLPVEVVKIMSHTANDSQEGYHESWAMWFTVEIVAQEGVRTIVYNSQLAPLPVG